jgi:2-polyprenyl-3-methyl-5-hydroxy-6-metoxy-1,4-benzoquinol methylase
MTAKEHYENHLGRFYTWLTGDVNAQSDWFASFCVENQILPQSSRQALDLGAGNGIQSLSLARLGFSVTAVDFNRQLLSELSSRAAGLPIEILNEDIRKVAEIAKPSPELITCCGDTLAHLDSFAEVREIIHNIHTALQPAGKLILSFRDYSVPLEDTARFIPVKSEANRVFTCFLEYTPDKVRVTDLLYEFDNGRWSQKLSSYNKTRLTAAWVIQALTEAGFRLLVNSLHNRMVFLVAQKQNERPSQP